MLLPPAPIQAQALKKLAEIAPDSRLATDVKILSVIESIQYQLGQNGFTKAVHRAIKGDAEAIAAYAKVNKLQPPEHDSQGNSLSLDLMGLIDTFGISF